MADLFLYVAAFLLFNLAIGAVRVLQGPTQADRMMAAQLFGTNGVAIILLLIPNLKMHSLIDIALVYALLALVAALAFVKRVWYEPSKEQDD